MRQTRSDRKRAPDRNGQRSLKDSIHSIARCFAAETFSPATQAVKVPSERATIAFDTFYALKEEAKLQ